MPVRYVSTSCIARPNLTTRMGFRSFSRLTHGLSKKSENPAAAVSLHFMHYNFARPRRSPAGPYPQTPAIAAVGRRPRWEDRKDRGTADCPALGLRDAARERRLGCGATGRLRAWTLDGTPLERLSSEFAGERSHLPCSSRRAPVRLVAVRPVRGRRGGYHARSCESRAPLHFKLINY